MCFGILGGTIIRIIDVWLKSSEDKREGELM